MRTPRPTWLTRLGNLYEFARAEGDTSVPRSYIPPSGRRLGNWIHRSRAENANTRLGNVSQEQL
ncbi:helicase associated domain-containing protein [Leifsonia aquatica]|uniref:helicase associated domain-containing protein n=1 Tax=Leifsonia aquatica TaxID=144185 RepID=UPI0037F65C79